LIQQRSAAKLSGLKPLTKCTSLTWPSLYPT
jgi:hypothetical protein